MHSLSRQIESSAVACAPGLSSVPQISSAGTSLSALPIEIVRHALSFLTCKELLLVQQTTSAWRSLAKELWQERRSPCSSKVRFSSLFKDGEKAAVEHKDCVRDKFLYESMERYILLYLQALNGDDEAKASAAVMIHNYHTSCEHLPKKYGEYLQLACEHLSLTKGKEHCISLSPERALLQWLEMGNSKNLNGPDVFAGDSILFAAATLLAMREQTISGLNIVWTLLYQMVSDGPLLATIAQFYDNIPLEMRMELAAQAMLVGDDRAVNQLVMQEKIPLVDVYSTLVIAEFYRSKYSNVIVLCDLCLKMDAENALAFVFRGKSNFELGKYDAAVSDFSHVLRLKPDENEVDILLFRANSYYALGQCNLALCDIDFALQQDPVELELLRQLHALKDTVAEQ